MFRKRFLRFVVVAGFMMFQTSLEAQEFPVAVGSDSTFAQGGAFDGHGRGTRL